jgi:hypothetical protein
MKLRLAVISLILIFVAGFGGQSMRAQSYQSAEYYEATGHYIRGEFLNAYHSVDNPQELFGNPITEAFPPDPTSSDLVQYFEKARFVSHTDASGNQRIELSLLGSYLHRTGQPQAIIANSPACRSFPQVAYQVCHAFLVFFDDNGGVAQFGYPISNLEEHNGRTVQYFERARLEWHPDLPLGKRMVVGNLGAEYFHDQRENLQLLKPLRRLPEERDNIIGVADEDVQNLKVHAYPQFAVTGSSGKQTVYITVQDQRLLPVSNADVTIIVHYPSGQLAQPKSGVKTDANGIAKYIFEFPEQPLGVVTIDVVVSYVGITGKTVTSFRIWW